MMIYIIWATVLDSEYEDQPYNERQFFGAHKTREAAEKVAEKLRRFVSGTVFVEPYIITD